MPYLIYWVRSVNIFAKNFWFSFSFWVQLESYPVDFLWLSLFIVFPRRFSSRRSLLGDIPAQVMQLLLKVFSSVIHYSNLGQLSLAEGVAQRRHCNVHEKSLQFSLFSKAVIYSPSTSIFCIRHTFYFVDFYMAECH